MYIYLSLNLHISSISSVHLSLSPLSIYPSLLLSLQFINQELGFKEDHFLILTKLVVYFLLNLVGISAGLYGYLVKPFERTRLLVAVGSAVYLVATGIWTLILQYCMVATLYRGRDKQGKIIWIRSSIKYPQGIYRLESLKPGTNKPIGKAMEISVGEWIDLDGTVLADRLIESLKEKLVPNFKLE